MRRIVYSRQAAKSLQKMDGATSKRIRGKIKLLADDPEVLANNVRKLKGAEGLMRLRIGDWRVIYTDDGIILSVQRVASRGSVYK